MLLRHGERQHDNRVINPISQLYLQICDRLGAEESLSLLRSCRDKKGREARPNGSSSGRAFSTEKIASANITFVLPRNDDLNWCN